MRLTEQSIFQGEGGTKHLQEMLMSALTGGRIGSVLLLAFLSA